MSTPPPTDRELEILEVIWARGEATVREVYEALRDDLPIVQNTVQAFLRTMTEKRLVSFEKRGRTFYYRAEVEPEPTRDRLLGRVLSRVYDGALDQDPRLKIVRDHARQQVDPYGDIFTANLHILRLAAANPGLYRCVLNQGSEDDTVAVKWQAFSQQHAARGAHRVMRARPEASIEDLTLKATLLGGMIDDFCKNLFVLADPAYCATWNQRFEDETEMAVFLSDVWYETMMNKPAPKDKSEWINLVSEQTVL